MAEENAGDLKVGDTVWLFEAAREPPQYKRRVRAITLKDGEANAARAVTAVPWSLVRSRPLEVRIELDPAPTVAEGSAVFPCAEPLTDARRAREASKIGVIAAVACGLLALIALGAAILFWYGPLVFVAVQAAAAVAAALFTAVVWPRFRR